MSVASGISRLASVRPTGLSGPTSVATWFRGREKRERVLIFVGGLMAVGYLGWIGVYQPLSAMRADALRDIAAYEAIDARLAAGGPDWAASPKPASSAPTASVITDSAVAAGLSIRRLEPEGRLTWIEIDNADFGVLIGWIASLERDHGLKVASIDLDRRPEPGIVSARISMENE